MKKPIAFLFILLFISFQSNAQNSENIWMLSPWSFIGSYSGLNFNSGVADTFTVQRNMGFFITNTGICDTSGNLLFYTNGVRINNANHDTLLNSDNFNPGYASTINSQQLNVPQGALILPKPSSDSLYYIFHVSGESFFANGQQQQQPLSLKYSIVDMNLDSGLGGIHTNKKGIVILNDTMVNGLITACKHGNGRDWWIMEPRFYSNLYYKFLLTPDSLYGPFMQDIGSSITQDIDNWGNFSSDGSKYAQVAIDNSLNIYQFDRCSGLFYDSTFIQVPNPTPGYPDNQAYGLAFSPNSRFLYINLYTRIIQYDTWSANIAATQTYVAQWDTFVDPFPTFFFNAQLAPDNKIYIGTYGADKILHYINDPDSIGLSCNVIQNSFFLPYDNITVPTYPNYDLGRLTGSPCDTLPTGIQSLALEKNNITVYPNPASDFIKIKYDIPPNTTATFTLYNTMGETVSKNNLYGTFKTLLIHTNTLNDGIYYWSITANNKKLQTGKLAIIH